MSIIFSFLHLFSQPFVFFLSDRCDPGDEIKILDSDKTSKDDAHDRFVDEPERQKKKCSDKDEKHHFAIDDHDSVLHEVLHMFLIKSGIQKPIREPFTSADIAECREQIKRNGRQNRKKDSDGSQSQSDGTDNEEKETENPASGQFVAIIIFSHFSFPPFSSFLSWFRLDGG